MARLIFNASDVRRVVEHSLAAPKQGLMTTGYDAKAHKMITARPKAPAVILVHDQGVYLMSNGDPGDILEAEKPSRYVAYAKGCDPREGGDGDWWDNARALVGGDDFGEHFEWAEAIKQMLDDGASHIVVNFGRTTCSLSAQYPKGKGPKPAEASPEQYAANLARVLKRRIVFLDPASKKLLQKPAAKGVERAHQVTEILRSRPGAVILNNLPLAEAVRVCQQHAR